MIKETEVLRIGGRMTIAFKNKKILLTQKAAIAKFKDDLRNLDWRDLVVKRTGKSDNDIYYKVLLPKNLMDDFDRIEKMIKLLDEKFQEVGYFQIWGGENVEYDKFEISIDIHKIAFNKIDIGGDGLPLAYRGLGLGRKIYKRIILEVGQISSGETQSYKNSQLLWTGLFMDEELYTFMDKRWIYAFLKSHPPETIVLFLEKVFAAQSKGECLFDEDFESKNLELLKNSKVAHHFI